MEKINLIKKQRSWMEISLSNYQYNIYSIQKLLPRGCKILQVVKADAYGHGAVEIAKKAVSLGINFFGVANVMEGIQLRKNKIYNPILVLSPNFNYEIPDILEYNLIPTISTMEFAKKLSDSVKNNKIAVHINIDTGFGRSGFYLDKKNKLKNTIEQIYKLPNLSVEGIFSHFAASDDDVKFTKIQTERFKSFLNTLSFVPEYIHISNGCGIFSSDLEGFNLVRVGLISYGAPIAFQKEIKLKPVMSFKTKIIQIKGAEIGDSIGYNRTYIAKKRIKYAILPIGYADGYNFFLSGKGVVLINGSICNIIGRVSMDMIAVDITPIQAQCGDTVTLVGWENKNIFPQEVANLFGGSVYEILCNAGKRSTKFFFEHQKLLSVYAHQRRDKLPNIYYNVNV